MRVNTEYDVLRRLEPIQSNVVPPSAHWIVWSACVSSSALSLRCVTRFNIPPSETEFGADADSAGATLRAKDCTRVLEASPRTMASPFVVAMSRLNSSIDCISGMSFVAKYKYRRSSLAGRVLDESWMIVIVSASVMQTNMCARKILFLTIAVDVNLYSKVKRGILARFLKPCESCDVVHTKNYEY